MYRVRRWQGRLAWCAIICCIASANLWQPASADGPPPASNGGLDADTASDRATFEMGAGAQTFSRAWSLYTDVTAAPFAGLDQDGLRVRAVGGYGAYGYSGRRPLGVGSQIVDFKGASAFADLLGGYQKQLGPLTLKGFAGLMVTEHRLTPDDPETAVHGQGFGAKLALEAWWTLSERAWWSADVSWGTLYDSYSARGRLGWRLLPALSAGLETGAFGNVECDVARAGGFVRYEWATGEVSASTGWSNDSLLDSGPRSRLMQSSTPFATFSWLTRF